jgi:hypothetical protein
MARHDTSIVGTAGEHFVAFRLSQLGFVVALPRAGTPTVDLLVSNREGTRSVTIQVKTAEWAERMRGRGSNKKLDRVEFPLGHKAAYVNAPSVFYVFVDLKGRDKDSVPTVYVVPSLEIFQYCEGWAKNAKLVRWHPLIDKARPFENNWDPIVELLKGSE